MKKAIFCLFLSLSFYVSSHAQAQAQALAQKWSALSDEEKLLKAESFRNDNQSFLQNTLKMSDDQRMDIDNVNMCYVASLDRIARYGKDDAAKEKWAKTSTQARNAQLDVIMGADNHKKYAEYIVGKIKKAAGK